MENDNYAPIKERKNSLPYKMLCLFKSICDNLIIAGYMLEYKEKRVYAGVPAPFIVTINKENAADGLDHLVELARIKGIDFILEAAGFVASNIDGETFKGLYEDIKKLYYELRQIDKRLLYMKTHPYISRMMCALSRNICNIFYFLKDRGYFVYSIFSIETYITQPLDSSIRLNFDIHQFEREKYTGSDLPESKVGDYINDYSIYDLIHTYLENKIPAFYILEVLDVLNGEIIQFALGLLERGDEDKKTFARDLLLILSNTYNAARNILRDIIEHKEKQ